MNLPAKTVIIHFTTHTFAAVIKIRWCRRYQRMKMMNAQNGSKITLFWVWFVENHIFSHLIFDKKKISICHCCDADPQLTFPKSILSWILLSNYNGFHHTLIDDDNFSIYTDGCWCHFSTYKLHVVMINKSSSSKPKARCQLEYSRQRIATTTNAMNKRKNKKTDSTANGRSYFILYFSCKDDV